MSVGARHLWVVPIGGLEAEALQEHEGHSWPPPASPLRDHSPNGAVLRGRDTDTRVRGTEADRLCVTVCLRSRTRRLKTSGPLPPNHQRSKTNTHMHTPRNAIKT